MESTMQAVAFSSEDFSAWHFLPSGYDRWKQVRAEFG